MWAVIVFPTLIWPLGSGRPTHCHRCGSDGPFYVHSRRIRQIANVNRFAPSGAEMLTEQPTLRFRCGGCGCTSTTTHSGRAKGFRLQWFLHAKVVAWYALGLSPSSILAYLGTMGTPVSRATLYRIIASVRDPHLSEIHWASRRRISQMAARGQPFHFAQGSWETGLTGEVELAVHSPSPVFGPDDRYAAGSLILRLTSFVFSMYHTQDLAETLAWLDSYLQGIGGAGVLRYPSREALDRAFSTDESLPHDLRIERGALRPDGPHGRLNIASPYVRQAVVSALRQVDQPDESSWRPTVRSARPRSFLHLDEVDDADLWDPLS